MKSTIIKIIIIIVIVLIISIGVIFLTKYLLGVFGITAGISGSLFAFKKLLDIKKEAVTQQKSIDTKISEVNNVITANNTNYDNYQRAVDSMSSDTALLNENARLSAERKAKGHDR